MFANFYVVVRGRRPGVYDNWEDTKRQVNGVSGAVYKGYRTLQGTAARIREHPQLSVDIQLGRTGTSKALVKALGPILRATDATLSPSKMVAEGVVQEQEEQEVKLPPDVPCSPTVGPKYRSKAKKHMVYASTVAELPNLNLVPGINYSPSTHGPIYHRNIDAVVKVDGAYSSKSDLAGCGVFICGTPPEGRSFRLDVPPYTNNRAELRALIEAFRDIREKRLGPRVLILTDSKYSFSAITEWYDMWKRQGALEKMQNMDLITPAVELWREITCPKGTAVFGAPYNGPMLVRVPREYVPEADALATAARC